MNEKEYLYINLSNQRQVANNYYDYQYQKQTLVFDRYLGSDKHSEKTLLGKG